MNSASQSLRNLASFGDVAAEDDAVLDYFLATDAVRDIAENRVFLILGRKGAGKTAIVRHFSEGTAATVSRALSLRGYPWNLHAQRIDRGASEIEAYVSSWRYLLVSQLAALVLSKVGGDAGPEATSIREFFRDNYGGPNVELSRLLRPQRLRLSKLSFEPTVLGNKLGGVALERSPTDLGLGLELNALTDSILEATRALCAATGMPPLLLHLDELDQGLSSLDESRARMLIGLILAARALRQQLQGMGTTVNTVVYLRTDLWDDLEFSDKNKISQTSALHLAWDAESLQRLVNARLSSKLSPGATWDAVAAPELMRGSQTKWNHVLSRTFLRPRDVIKFLNAALERARGRADEPLVLSNEDIVGARDTYSRYLKDELDDEILPHWTKWEEALQACSAVATVTFEREQFVQEYEKRRSSDNKGSADDALARLYRFSVVGYERRSGYGGSSWAFQYTDPEAGWDNSATRFKVHLGLKEYARLREERR
jgi:hypothetical protein